MDWTNWSTSETEEYRVKEECPKKRYVRYGIIIGGDEMGTVYKGFDKKDGIEIGLYKIDLKKWEAKNLELKNQKIHTSYRLQMLDHENLVKCYHSWDKSRKFFNIITDTFTPGNLRDYINRHPSIDEKALKNWCRQILKALHYLHTRDPPIIHHDIKIENILIDGESGKVKLGYFGYAFPYTRGRMLTDYPFTSVTMAPEIFGLEYDEKIDIHSFGMTVLQMLNRGRNVYSECDNEKERIYDKIRRGLPPDALHRMRDSTIFGVLLKSICERSKRDSAIDLLNYEPFLREYVFETTPAAVRSELERIQILRISAEVMATRLQDAADRKWGNLSQTLTGETSTRTEQEEEEGKDEYNDEEEEEETPLNHRRSSRQTRQQHSESQSNEPENEESQRGMSSPTNEDEV